MDEPLKLGRPGISVPVLSRTIDRLASKSCAIPRSVDSPSISLLISIAHILALSLLCTLSLSLSASLCISRSRRPIPIPILHPTRLTVLPHLPVVPRDDIDEEIEHVRKGYRGCYVGSLEGATFVRFGNEPGPAGKFGDEYWLGVSGCGVIRSTSNAFAKKCEAGLGAAEHCEFLEGQSLNR